MYIIWKYLVTKKEEAKKIVTKMKIPRWSQGRLWFIRNLRHEMVDNKMYCVVRIVCHSKYELCEDLTQLHILVNSLYLSRRQKPNNGGQNSEMEVHSEGKRDQKGTQKTTWSTNRDTVSARTRCGEPSNLRVGP